MYCVSVVRDVVVECRTLMPCFVGERGICGVIVLRISLSRIMIGLHNKEIGLYGEASVGNLLGLRRGMILSFFRMCGMLLWTIVWLKMSVREIRLLVQGVLSADKIYHRGLWILLIWCCLLLFWSCWR